MAEEAHRLLALRSLMAATQALDDHTQQQQHLQSPEEVEENDLPEDLSSAIERPEEAEVRSDATKENGDDIARLSKLRQALGTRPSQQESNARGGSRDKAFHSESTATGRASIGSTPGAPRTSSVPRSSLNNNSSFVSSPATSYSPEDYQTFEEDRLTNTSVLSSGGASVYDRLYAKRKPRSSTGSVDRSDFHPKIDPKSRQIASAQGERVSLYERALQRKYRLETKRDMRERQAREDRSRSKLSQSSQELAWNKLKREIEQLFAARVQANTPEGQELSEETVMALTKDEFGDVMKHLNLHEIAEQIFDLLLPQGEDRFDLQTFCVFIKHISFPVAGDEQPEIKLEPEFVARVKRLLIGKKAVPSTASLERVFREVQAETPFSPQITERSRMLDEKRYLKMGIDPTLPRSEKIHAELKVQTERKESNRLRLAKQELAECTFRPKTTRFAPSTTRTSTQLAVIQDIVPAEDEARKPADVGSRLFRESIERKNRLMAKAADRMNKQLSEIASECTFKPQTNVGRKTSSQALVVFENPKAFEKSVQRLQAWREKHVVEEDPLDIAKQPRPQRQQVSAAPRPRPTSYRDARKVIFEAEVNLPNGQVKQIQVKEGENLKRVAYLFARRNDLDKQAEDALAESLLEGMRSMQAYQEEAISTEDDSRNVADEYGEENAESAEVSDENAMMVDVLVRPGETYTLRITEADDPEELAYEFAAAVRMDDDARDALIESLRSLQV